MRSARQPRCGCGSRPLSAPRPRSPRPAPPRAWPPPPLPPAPPCAGLRAAAAPPPPGRPLAPRGGPCGSLTPPLPRRPRPGSGRGAAPPAAPRAGERRAGRAGQEGGPEPRALSPNPDAPVPPAPPGAGQRKPGGAGSGLRWGRGAPPSPRPGSCFRNKRFPRGSPDLGPGVLPRAAGRRPGGDGGTGHRVLVTARGRG